jgi:hypothetical protein
MRSLIEKRQTRHEAEATPNASFFAELVLEVLDGTYYRDGRAIEYDDPLSSGPVRIKKGRNGRVHFRTPSVPETSIRLNPARNALLTKDNVGQLEKFFEKNQLVLRYLNEKSLKYARR